jgi:hypothetical protein
MKYILLLLLSKYVREVSKYAENIKWYMSIIRGKLYFNQFYVNRIHIWRPHAHICLIVKVKYTSSNIDGHFFRLHRQKWNIVFICEFKIQFGLKILLCNGPPTTIPTKLMFIRSFTYKEDSILQTHGVLVLIEKSWHISWAKTISRYYEWFICQRLCYWYWNNIPPSQRYLSLKCYL